MSHRFATCLLIGSCLFTLGCDRIETFKQSLDAGGEEDTLSLFSSNASKENEAAGPDSADAPEGADVFDDTQGGADTTLEDIENRLSEKLQALEEKFAQHAHIVQKMTEREQAHGHADDKPTSQQSLTSDPMPLSDAPASMESTMAAAPYLKKDIFDRGFSDIAAATLPSVVSISTMQVVDGRMGIESGPRMMPGFPLEELFKDFFEQQYERPRRIQSVGSGFVVAVTDKEAFVVTNNHVIADAKKTSVIFSDKTEVEAVLHAGDDRTDLAVLKIKLESLPKDRRRLKPLKWGDSDAAKIGNFVIAIGNPFGLGNTMTSGIISGKGRDIVLQSNAKPTDLVDDFIQHDASLNVGNSGGVLVDMDGEVIGINTAIFSPNGGNIGIGFAIPSSLAKSTVDQLIEHGRAKRGWLGLSVVTVSPEIAASLGLGEVRGGIVKSVVKDGPSDKAGIKPRDIIIEFDGKSLGERQRLTRLVGDTQVGKTVSVKVLRDEKEISVQLEVGEYPEIVDTKEVAKKVEKVPSEKVTEVLGMKLIERPKMLKTPFPAPLNPFGSGEADIDDQSGVMIIGVAEGSSAEDSGLRKGDIVTEVNMQDVNSPKDMAKRIQTIHENDPKRPSVLLTVTRAGSAPQYVAVHFKSLLDENKEISDADKMSQNEGPQLSESAADGPNSAAVNPASANIASFDAPHLAPKASENEAMSGAALLGQEHEDGQNTLLQEGR